MVTSDGHYFSRRFPDKKLNLWPFGLREGPHSGFPNGHYFAMWPLPMATIFPESSLTKIIVWPFCLRKVPQVATSDGQLFSDQELKFWPFGLRAGCHFQWSNPHIPFFYVGI
jgi:hypothetical protein